MVMRLIIRLIVYLIILILKKNLIAIGLSKQQATDADPKAIR